MPEELGQGAHTRLAEAMRLIVACGECQRQYDASGREIGSRFRCHCGKVVTVEEGCLTGGFGAAVCEALADAGVHTTAVRRLGIGDSFVPHGNSDSLRAECGIDAKGIERVCLDICGVDPGARQSNVEPDATVRL